MTMEKAKSVLGVQEMKNWKLLLKQLFAEFLGTFLYISIFPQVCSQVKHSLVIGIADGLLVASIVQVVGHVSGGHINPAITVGMAVCRYIKPLRGMFYFLAQVVGAIAGAAVAYVTSTEENIGDLGATVPHEDLSIDQVFALELIMTFILVAVALSVSDPLRGAKGSGSAPLAIGLSITAVHTASIPYSGSMNPVRSLGSAVVMNIWTEHWVYWVGPILGGLLAGFVHRFILSVNVNSVV